MLGEKRKTRGGKVDSCSAGQGTPHFILLCSEVSSLLL